MSDDETRGCLCCGADDVIDQKCPYCHATDALLRAISEHHSGDVHEGRRIRDAIVNSDWLAAQKRKWQADALREAASACSSAFATNPDARGKWSRIAADAIETTLTARAERIERTKP